jgi:hypothetical protein
MGVDLAGRENSNEEQEEKAKCTAFDISRGLKAKERKPNYVLSGSRRWRFGGRPGSIF